MRPTQQPGGSPRIYGGRRALNPDFLCSLVAPARFLRLSLTKAAYAVASCAAYRKSGFSAGDASALGVDSLQSAADKLLIPKNRFHRNE